MKFQQFIELCQSRDWEQLIFFLSSDAKDLATKILVTALIQAYHPERKTVEEYGLSIWDKYLANNVVAPLQSLITTEVDLKDFLNAYLYATAHNGLNDQHVGEVISSYVKKHRIDLASLLEAGNVTEEDKKTITKFFGDLRLTRAEKEASFKKTFDLQTQDKRKFIIAKEQARLLIEDIFNFPKGEIIISFECKIGKRGFFMSNDDGRIRFKNDHSLAMLNAFAEMLKSIGINANAYLMPSAHTKSGITQGIQLLSPVETIAPKLAAFKQFLLANTDSPSSSLQPQDMLQAMQALNSVKQQANDKPVFRH